MFGIALFVLREVFEIALIVSVVIAATRGVVGRTRFILMGFLFGMAGAAMIAIFASNISNLAYGMGQEILNAAILLAAASMIGWTAVWMRVHGRELAGKVKEATNNSSMWILSTIIALAVFREGAEMVLFSFGAHAQGSDWADIFTGGLLGILGGGVIGVLFYAGMITLFARYFLTATSTLLAFLAAGLAAKAIYYLAIIGIVPEFGSQIWDSSKIIANNSILGESLSILIGYNAAPSGIELITYIATLMLIFVGFKISAASVKKLRPQTVNTPAI